MPAPPSDGQHVSRMKIISESQRDIVDMRARSGLVHVIGAYERTTGADSRIALMEWHNSLKGRRRASHLGRYAEPNLSYA